MRLLLLVCALFGFLLLSSISMKGASFGFGDPKVIKLDWSTRSLRVSDLDGDGLEDMAVINNDSSQIELLYQLDADGPSGETKRRLERDRWTPVLEDALFEKDKVAVGVPMFDLGVGDLNGDGLPDLAYTARDVPLTIRFQSEGGKWIDSQEFDGFEALGWNSTLEVVDVDGDDRLEVVLLSADAVRVFSLEASGGIGGPQVYFLTGENPFNLEVVDLTGDGLAEICYITSEGKQSLVMREQISFGVFGAERRFLLEQPVRMFSPLGGNKAKEPTFAGVNSRSGGIELFTLQSSVGGQVDFPLAEAQPEIYPVFSAGKDGAHYAFGDLNGDGIADLQVANSGGSELMVFIKKDGRFLPSRRFPTFSKISSLSAGRFFEDMGDVIVALSEAEKNLGLSQYDVSGRVSFPRLISVGTGESVVCEAIDLDGDGFDELALVNRTDDGLQLVVARPAERGKFTSEWELVLQKNLDGVRRDPERIRVLNTFGGRGPGLMLFVPREAPVLLAQGDGDRDAYDLEFVGVGSSIRESLLKEVRPSQVSSFDVDGDGFDELVAARKGFARAIRFVEGRLEMVDQFNSRREGDAISAVIPFFDSDGLKRIAMYVAKEGELQFLNRESDGVLRYRNTEKVGVINLDGWSAHDAEKSGAATVLFYGADRFWYFSGAGSRWARDPGESYETELEDVFFNQLEVGDFDGDGLDDIIAVDGNENVVEVLRRREDSIDSAMFWQVFDQNMHYQGRTGAQSEPRQAVVADLNGDGLLDLAFLVHDRVIFYLQE